MYEDFLPFVTKPARYIDNEVNAVHKDHGQVKTRICLFFPDAYEVGMSHLGLRILYHILNARNDTVCERVFSPWPDYEARLRAANRPLTSLETNTPLREFDIIGITLQYELSYSNVLSGIELAGIPLRAREREAHDPVVIAGGPCAANPAPLASFIDAFFIGEAEEAVNELPVLHQQYAERRAFLEALSRSPGWYVPAFGNTPVRRRIVADIENAAFPDRPLVPLLRPVHDRVTVEIARGCIRGCRFCQAGIIYRPYRERSAACIKDILEESLRCTGYDELSLASLSSGDHSEIQPLMQELADQYRDSRISLSLPSLRIGTLTPDMIRAVAGVRKTGFTLAPEAGTERLRRVINKPVSDADLMEAARTIFASGWSVLKLYFMIGLPTETDEDLEGIIRLAQELFSAGRRVAKRHVQINITVSTFVPKPHTPFQWFGQAPQEEIKRKQAYLAARLNKKGIAVKPHDPQTSQLEGAFARGDASLGQVLEAALRLGCRFDGWSEEFDYAKWEEAFRTCGIDLAAYACRSFGPDDPLPWDFIRTGITKQFLRAEFERASAAEATPNCREHCAACGLGCPDGGSTNLGKTAAAKSARAQGKRTISTGRERSPGARIRMQFEKSGRMRFLAHLDLMTIIQRSAFRAGLPVAFSQGFNPHPRISFGPALPVGMESTSEFLDMETTRYVDPGEAQQALNASLPDGIIISASRIVPGNAPSLSGSITRYVYEITVPEALAAELPDRIRRFLSQDAVLIEKEGKQKDLRPCIESATVDAEGPGRAITLTLKDRDGVKPRIQDILVRLFSAAPEELHAFGIVRREMLYWDGRAWKSPMHL
ncbi:MAG TPA: TIGR03960 family B12-binding radical SAM protein [Nitrospirota bacterium]|nr:TIGR03960 family B12-binding radical SAM protein [Nitrospirota bacterium]